MNKQSATHWDVVHVQRRIVSAGSTTTTGVTSMRRILTALGLLGVLVASAAPASAQYYGPAYGGYGPDPHYRGYDRAYRRAYGEGEYYAPRPYRRGAYGPRTYAGGDLTPQFDPRNGGFFCADPRFTVQDGICKPYRGY
jgi:hypothetical protein